MCFSPSFKQRNREKGVGASGTSIVSPSPTTFWRGRVSWTGLDQEKMKREGMQPTVSRLLRDKWQIKIPRADEYINDELMNNCK